MKQTNNVPSVVTNTASLPHTSATIRSQPDPSTPLMRARDWLQLPVQPLQRCRFLPRMQSRTLDDDLLRKSKSIRSQTVFGISPSRHITSLRLGPRMRLLAPSKPGHGPRHMEPGSKSCFVVVRSIYRTSPHWKGVESGSALNGQNKKRAPSQNQQPEKSLFT